MKKLILTALTLCFAFVVYSQEKKPAATKIDEKVKYDTTVKFKPPVLKSQAKTPPKVVKKKSTASSKKTSKQPPKVDIIKFKPPVLKKDTSKKS